MITEQQRGPEKPLKLQEHGAPEKGGGESERASVGGKRMVAEVEAAYESEGDTEAFAKEAAGTLPHRRRSHRQLHRREETTAVNEEKHERLARTKTKDPGTYSVAQQKTQRSEGKKQQWAEREVLYGEENSDEEDTEEEEAQP
ncbi:hypothetical protein Efla_006073 [Eimeria flavescens]